MNAPNAWIGSSIDRLEDRRFICGQGTYVGDLAPDGLKHALILRSPVAHGRIERIDASAALAIPGVLAMITADEIGSPVPRIPMRQHAVPEGERYLQPVIASEKVRYVGEPIAVIVAQAAAIAEDALAAISLHIAELPPVADHHSAARDDVLLFEAAGTNLARPGSARGRRGCCICGGRLQKTRAVQRAAAHGTTAGDARPPGRVECRYATPCSAWCGEGAIL